MTKLAAFIQSFVATVRSEERGATATEYALLVGLIAFAIAGALTLFAGRISAEFGTFTF